MLNLRRSIPVFALILGSQFLISCGNQKATAPTPSTFTLGKSYNEVASTFSRIRVNPLHEAGFRGNGIVLQFQDADDLDLANSELSHTVIEGRMAISGVDGHATAMARVASGSLNAKGQIGLAPQAKIATHPDDIPLAKIISNSIIDTNLYSCGAGYTLPVGGVDQAQGRFLNPPTGPATRIHVVIAGNFGPGTPTNMGWGIPDGYYPVQGNIIVTVAVDENNQLTSTSSRCGKTGRFCIAVPSTGPTSPTAPVVSGALALLMEAVPNLPIRDYVDAILRSATPLPTPADQTGVGLLNVEGAWNYLKTSASNSGPRPHRHRGGNCCGHHHH